MGLRYGNRVDIFNADGQFNGGRTHFVWNKLAERGVVRIFKKVSFLIQDADLSPIEGARVYAVPYDDLR